MSRRQGVRPSLTTLLALRHASAETARAEHGAAVAARHAAQERLRQLHEQLACHEVTGPRWALGIDERARLGEAMAAARTAVASAAAFEDRARQRWVIERRSERVIEKLVERVESARAAAAARAEQIVLDEVGLIAHARDRRTPVLEAAS